MSVRWTWDLYLPALMMKGIYMPYYLMSPFNILFMGILYDHQSRWVFFFFFFAFFLSFFFFVLRRRKIMLK